MVYFFLVYVLIFIGKNSLPEMTGALSRNIAFTGSYDPVFLLSLFNVVDGLTDIFTKYPLFISFERMSKQN